MSTPDIVRVLDCQHVFHAKCVDPWFLKATSCPLCKRDLTLVRNTSQSSQTSSSTGQILFVHSNSDPVLLRVQESLHNTGSIHGWQFSGMSLSRSSHSDRSLPVMGSSRSERSIGILSTSSSGALPAVQEDGRPTNAEGRVSFRTVRPGSQDAARLVRVQRGHQGRHSVQLPVRSVASGEPHPASSTQLQRGGRSLELPVPRAVSGEPPPASPVQVHRGYHNVELPVHMAASGEPHSLGSAWVDSSSAPEAVGRHAASLAQLQQPNRGNQVAAQQPLSDGHSRIIPPDTSQDTSLQDGAPASSHEGSLPVTPPVAQANPHGADDSLSGSLRSTCVVVSSTPSAASTAASTARSLPASTAACTPVSTVSLSSTTPPALTHGQGVAPVVAHRVVQSLASFSTVRSTSTTYVSAGNLHGGVAASPSPSLWTGPVLTHRLPQTQRVGAACIPAVPSRSYTSLRP